jgi:hypothetical protein
MLSSGGAFRRKLEAVLSLIEQTIPVPTIMIDSYEGAEQHVKPFEGKEESILLSILRETYQILIQEGRSAAEARLYLSTLEPFHYYPHLFSAIDDVRSGGQEP